MKIMPVELCFFACCTFLAIMGHLIPLFVGTGFFGALFVFMPCFVKKGPNQGIIRCSMLLAVFCLWIFWATVYISQMHPLVGPRHKNSTLMWWRYQDGARPKKPGGREGVEEYTGGIRGDTAGRDVTKAAMEAKPPVPPKVPPVPKRRLDHCRDQPDNVFECCNIPWLPLRARVKCFLEPVNIFKLKCEDAKCAFQEAGWLTRPGDVSLAQLNAYYDNLSESNQDWLEAVELIKSQCLTPKFQSVYTNCVEFDILYCAMIRMLKHGPLENWSTAAACSASKHFTATCPICPDQCNTRELALYPENVCRACI